MTEPRSRLELLVVDDDPAIRASLRNVLEHAGHHVNESPSGGDALERLGASTVDVVLLDLEMPGMHGLDVLTRIRERAPDTAVIVVTGEGTARNGFRASQRGAYDFIEKPPDMQQLLDLIGEAARVTRLRRAAGDGADDAGRAVVDDGKTLGILGKSPAIDSLRENIRRIAPSQGRVLITGENGVGKELVAHAIHALSKRSAAAFIKMNCAAIPRDLIESELFGHEKGAFTGAVQARKGRLELAHEGTLFLDEIGDLSADAQAKLLRAIETGEAERVGGTRTQHYDVRFIAATNKELGAEIQAGDFREDLFYRLNVLPIHVPPLRERSSDVALLAARFLEQCCAVEGRPAKTLSDEARALLEEYPWPGNVRELRNLMERAAVLVEASEVQAGDLAPWLDSGPVRGEAVGLRGEIERREAETIRRALEGANWNVTQAAAGLGIDRTNLHRKMRKYGIARR
jgi:two-component system, NtrC family, nitrogen regulation response regulator NtrX